MVGTSLRNVSHFFSPSPSPPYPRIPYSAVRYSLFAYVIHICANRENYFNGEEKGDAVVPGIFLNRRHRDRERESEREIYRASVLSRRLSDYVA